MCQGEIAEAMKLRDHWLYQGPQNDTQGHMKDRMHIPKCGKCLLACSIVTLPPIILKKIRMILNNVAELLPLRMNARSSAILIQTTLPRGTNLYTCGNTLWDKYYPIFMGNIQTLYAYNIYVCLHSYIHMCAFIHTVYGCLFNHLCIHLYIQTDINTYIHMCIYTYMEIQVMHA